MKNFLKQFTVGAKSKFATLAKQVHVRRDRPMSAVVISNLMETSPWAVQVIFNYNHKFLLDLEPSN